MIGQFHVWLEKLGYSPFTVRNYGAEVSRFGAWLVPSSLDAASPVQVRKYVLRGAEAGELPATSNLRLASLRRYYEWSCRTLGRPPSDPTLGLQVRVRSPRPAAHVHEEAIGRILGVIGDRARDRAVFLLFAFCGLRLRELVELDRSNLVLESNVLRLRARGREVPVPPEARQALLAYLGERADAEPALFLTREGRRLAPRTIQGAFARYFGEAGVPGSIRALRHSFAVRWVRLGLGLNELQHLLGNRSLQSTAPYQAFAPSRINLRAEQEEELQSDRFR